MSLLILGAMEREFVEALAACLYTSTEAARYVGIAPRALWEETQQGRIHVLIPRPTSKRVYYKADLDAYIADRRARGLKVRQPASSPKSTPDQD